MRDPFPRRRVKCRFDNSNFLSESDSDKWRIRRREKQSRSERAAFKIRDGRDAARRVAVPDSHLS